MVEIFKTNVDNQVQAGKVLKQIHLNFSSYRANFDLEDCDKILRVTSSTESVEPVPLIIFLREIGIQAEVFRDDIDLFVPLCYDTIENPARRPC